MTSWRRPTEVAGWVTLAIAAIDLCGREMARRSLLRTVAGVSLEPWTVVLLSAVAATAVAYARGRTSRANHAAILAVLFAAGIAMQLQLGARLQSDGFYYFAYLRSLAFDRDVNFMNDYKVLGLSDKAHLFEPTPTGYAHSAWTIGPAIVWSPFFAAGHAIASRLDDRNPNVSADGTSFPYRQAVCVAGLFYGLLGCWFSFRLTGRFFAPRVAALATVFVAGGSFMLWYMVKEPSMTHAPSMAAVAAFIWTWVATRERRTPVQWALLGALAGFMALIRWQNVLFALLPACDTVVALVSAWRRSHRQELVAAIRDGVLFTAAATVAFVPQMIAWRSIYGTWLAISPIGPQIRWSDPHLLDILWSSRNGLLSWSPILYVGAAGLLLFAWRQPRPGVPMLLVLAAMTYFNSIIQDWWGSDGFGGRRFDGTIPLFCVGVASVATVAARVVQRHPLRAVAAAGAGLVIWNLTLMNAAQRGIFRIGETVSYGETMASQARGFHAWFGNPFTYPASLVFALRNDVSPGSYDLLWTNRFLSDPQRPYGTIDIGGADTWLVGEGWHAPERDGALTFRWSSQASQVVIPLDHAAPLRLQIRARTLVHPGANPQSVTVLVNGQQQPVIPLQGDWQTSEILVDERHWRSGVNRVELLFAWAVRPVDVGLGGDTRTLSAQVDYVRIQVDRP